MATAAPPYRSISVVVADGRRLVREGMYRMLCQIEGVRVVGRTASCEELFDFGRRVPFDVALVEAHIPNCGVIEATRILRREHASVHVVCFSMDATVDEVRAALAAGANGFLLREAGQAELETALHAAALGLVFLCPTIFRRLVKHYLRGDETSMLESLASSPMERQYLEFIAEGTPTAEISQRLAMSLEELKANRLRLMQRFGSLDVDGMLREALRIGALTEATKCGM